MRDAFGLLQQKEWRVIDQSTLGPLFGALQSFAADDAICTSVGAGESPATARAWVHHDTIVLGIQDTKLPNLYSAIGLLKKEGYDVIVRNSGGLAVVLDEGVLNLSLIFPDTEKGIDIDRGYGAMLALVKRMFADLTTGIEAYEIVGSYCPGSYDLSIGGKKFAGISQRRIKNGVAVQIYLCVTGSGAGRAELIRRFYEVGKQGELTKWTFPVIVPEVMASLTELLLTDLTIQDVMVRFLRALNQFCDQLKTGSLEGEEPVLYQGYLKRIEQRNEKALEQV